MFIVQRYVYRAKVRLMPADAGGVVLSFTGFDPKRSSLWLSNCTENVHAAFGGLRAFEDAAGIDADFHEMAAGRAPGYIHIDDEAITSKIRDLQPSDIRHLCPQSSDVK
jgi:hypothetical protein